eukprot:TRINITY_DN3642_c0_g1_i1.p1 TRINITY_DN3642_c0_g1~~TRINITY_DN3642_c0_g1_i1.p1  ORF type:complete len:718 (+),score=133.21 TRINITY_DN3642_c0_g1_i1:70-2223(+)
MSDKKPGPQNAAAGPSNAQPSPALDSSFVSGGYHSDSDMSRLDGDDANASRLTTYSVEPSNASVASLESSFVSDASDWENSRLGDDFDASTYRSDLDESVSSLHSGDEKDDVNRSTLSELMAPALKVAPAPLPPQATNGSALTLPVNRSPIATTAGPRPVVGTSAQAPGFIYSADTCGSHSAGGVYLPRNNTQAAALGPGFLSRQYTRLATLSSRASSAVRSVTARVLSSRVAVVVLLLLIPLLVSCWMKPPYGTIAWLTTWFHNMWPSTPTSFPTFQSPSTDESMTRFRDDLHQYWKNEVEPVRGAVTQFEQRIGTFDKYLQQLQSQLESVISQRESERPELRRLQQEVESLLLFVSRPEGSVLPSVMRQQLETRLSSIEKGLTAVTSHLQPDGPLYTQIQQLQQASTQHHQHIESLQQTIQDRVALQDLDRLKQRVDSMMESYNSLNSELSHVKSQVLQEQIQASLKEVHAALSASQQQLTTLQQQVSQQDISLDSLRSKLEATHTHVNQLSQQMETFATEDFVQQHVDEAMERLHADGTEQVDWAFWANGGHILEHSQTSQEHLQGLDFLSAWLHESFVDHQKPEQILKPDMTAGNCWPMKGQQGYVVIQLRQPVRLTQVAIEHLSHKIAVDFSSAPKRMALYGIRSMQHLDQADLLVSFEYRSAARQLQQFSIPQSDVAYPAVRLEIQSNHGNPNFTCLYRVRVHGEAVAQQS